MSKLKMSSRGVTSLVRRYGLAVVSVATALGLGLFVQGYTPRDVEFAFFLFAIAITVWYAGTGPAVVALVLSSLAVAYFFTAPLHSLYIKPSDVPYFIIYIAFGLLITGSAPLDAGSSKSFGKPVTNSKRKWRNAPSRPACSISPMTPFSSGI